MDSTASNPDPTCHPQSAPPTRNTSQPPRTAATTTMKTRCRANPTQSATLMASFTLCDNPYDVELYRLEIVTGLPRRYISGWFGRQRHKKKKNLEKEQAMSTAASPITASAGTPLETMPAGNASASLPVKKEAYDAAMMPQDSASGSVPVAGRKKRQRQTRPRANAPTKKRKTTVSEVPRSDANNIAPCTCDPPLAPTSASSLASGVLPTPGNEPSSVWHAPETIIKRSPSSLLFDKIQVKMERYTPPPGDFFSSNNAAPPSADTGYAMPPSIHQGQMIRPQSAVAEYMNNPGSSGERRRAIPNTAVVKKRAHQVRHSKIPQAETPARTSSPSDVAMKGQRQRDQYVGNVDSFRAQGSAATTSSSGFRVVTATNLDYQNVQAYRALSESTYQTSGQTMASPMRFSVPVYFPWPVLNPYSMQASYYGTQTSCLKPPTPPPGHPLYSTHRVQASYSAPTGVKPTPPLPALYQNLLPTSYTPPPSTDVPTQPPSVARADPSVMQGTYYYTKPANIEPVMLPSSYSSESLAMNANQSNQYPRLEATPAAGSNAPSSWISPQVYTPPAEYCDETEWLRGFEEHLENAPQYDAQMSPLYDPSQAPVHDAECSELDMLDPLSAPLKHLTDIVSPLCESLGISYGELATLDGEQRDVLMEKLLDEDMGERDPFKAAMGLVMASKLGLKWN